MTDVTREQVKEFLTLFFPSVLIDIIFEYLIQIEHDCRLIKTTTRTCNNRYCTINNDKIYEYDTDSKCLTSESIDEINGMSFLKGDICAYKDDIYVYHTGCMYVFDNNCKKIHTIEFYDDVICGINLIIIVVVDRIFISEHNKKLII